MIGHPEMKLQNLCNPRSQASSPVIASARNDVELIHSVLACMREPSGGVATLPGSCTKIPGSRVLDRSDISVYFCDDARIGWKPHNFNDTIAVIITE